jgi:hypothetical protein
LKKKKRFLKFFINSRNASDENPYQEVAEFAISLMVLPFSNTEEERLFSMMNNVKMHIYSIDEYWIICKMFDKS